MKSPVAKRSVVIAGHKTSVSLEDAFWQSLKTIAHERAIRLSDLVAAIDTNRQQGNLSSAIRLFVLDHFRAPPAPPRSRANNMSFARADGPHDVGLGASAPSVLRPE